MILSKFLEHLRHWSGAAERTIFEALANPLGRAGSRGDVQQPLIGRRALNDRGSLAVHGQYDRPARFGQVPHDVRGMIAERGHGLDVFRDVQDAVSVRRCMNQVLRVIAPRNVESPRVRVPRVRVPWGGPDEGAPRAGRAERRSVRNALRLRWYRPLSMIPRAAI